MSIDLRADHDGRSDALLAWHGCVGRDLPWRRTRDPWSVLVSELMLQQTQVARVIPKYEAFLARFPDASSCARAAPGEVIALWSGLGYNRRALHLHRCATVVVERYDGRLPETLDQLLDLPGVGPYTARAVLAFAFGRDVGVVDTNAARVLARWVGRPLARADVQEAADACVPPGSGWAWNQAVLDLGATICTAREAACERCPVLRWCRWGGSERHDPDPAVGTAGTGGTQSRFEGSDRQGRGRLVEALRAGPVSSDPTELAAVMGWPGDEARSASVATQLVRDGLIVQDRSRFRLP